MTTSLIDYALMAGASYISNRAAINRIPAPDVWLEAIDKRTSGNPSGFEATYFVGVNNEIVISFAGTDFGSFGGALNDFVFGDIPLVTGTSINGADQLVDGATGWGNGVRSCINTYAPLSFALSRRQRGQVLH